MWAPGQATAYVLPRPEAAAAGASTAQLLLLNELLAAGNEDNTYYGQQLKYQQQRQQQQQQRAALPPNYFANNWPSLRDLLLTVDYDESANALESNEQLNSRLLSRLRKLSDTAVTPNEMVDEDRSDGLTAMPAKKLASTKIASSPMKEHNTKKNVQFRKQYMSPCHFKICNMGRKRNAGSFVPY
ncbi:uncharacterized protein LOC115622352 [Scaptodrosophila lebanonensis]|uniref:Uncharacterized protein LOC115622352 n=1 Tax=Drosophila lebanonensis TaxID=7225 RepID=A0A6J2T5C3_DROLE|nr:uncharacterized protein LOC115622352 [Scaptodrosophila lebanonensis]